jgi:hypothetical protein
MQTLLTSTYQIQRNDPIIKKAHTTCEGNTVGGPCAIVWR